MCVACLSYAINAGWMRIALSNSDDAVSSEAWEMAFFSYVDMGRTRTVKFSCVVVMVLVINMSFWYDFSHLL